MIKTFFLSLFILFAFTACDNPSGDDSKKEIQKSSIAFSLESERLHSMSSSSYRVYDTNLSKDITDRSYIAIDDVDIAYSKLGRIYAQNSGETTLHIYHKGQENTFTLKVYDAKILSIQASSNTYSLHKDFSSSLTCKAFFDDYTSQDITHDVTWSSSDESIASIISNRLYAKSSGDVNITATYKNKSSFFTTSILQATMDSLILSDKSISIHEKTFQQFSARAHFSDGTDEDITHDVSWSTTAPQIAQIDTDALMFADQFGRCSIEAKVGAFSANIAVNVLQSSPRNLKIILPKDTPRYFTEHNNSISSYGCFKLLVDFDDGLRQLLDRGVRWKSSDTALLSIDENGCYKTLNAGKLAIKAEYMDNSTQSPLHVKETEIVSLKVYSPISMLQEGLSASLESIAIDKNSQQHKVTKESFWYSSNQEIVSVENTKKDSGLVLARKTGVSTIKTHFASLSASMDIIVGSPALKALKIIPDINESVPKGYIQNLKVYAYYIDGSTQEITQSVLFASEQEQVATVSNELQTKGELKALEKGETLISASYGSVIAEFLLKVTQPEVVSLIVDAPQTVVKRSDEMKIKAYAIYTDGRKREFTDVVQWSLYPSYIATISQYGNFYALNVGRVNVTARYEDIYASESITVVEPKIISILIQERANKVDVNKSISLRLYADYEDGRRDEITHKADWSSLDSNKASVKDGVVTGISVGDVKIKAFYKGFADALTITVFASEQNLSIRTDNNTTLSAGEDRQFYSVLTYSDGSEENVSHIATWQSSDETIVTVSSQGVFHAVAAGVATITSSYHNFSDTMDITVQ